MREGEDLVVGDEAAAVLAADAAAAHDGKADLAGPPRAGDPVAASLGDLGERHAPALRGGLAQHQGGAGGGIDLAPMVGLEDLDVIRLGPKLAGRLLEETHEHVDAEREVDGADDGD